MKEFTSIDDLFLHVETLGALTIEHVLLQFIYPRAFICSNEDEIKYLFYEIKSINNSDTWAVCEINNLNYINVLNKTIPIQTAYKNSTDENIYLVLLKYDKDIATLKNITCSEVLKLLPDEDVYYEEE